MATPRTFSSEHYPIGPPDRTPHPESRASHVAAVEAFPQAFSSAYAGLHAMQIDTPYREGGWTLRQLAHHVADSHMNAFARVKFALTEEWPAIQPYDEKLWAETAEARGPVDPSLAILTALHARWAALLASLTPEQWERGYVHPESGRVTLTQAVALYSWHGQHHLAHVVRLRERMGW